MTIDVNAIALQAKQRIKNGTHDERDTLIVTLLNETANALLSSAENYKTAIQLRKEMGATQEQVRSLTRANDILASKLAKTAGHEQFMSVKH